jgi:hypothetical protein
MSMRAALGLTQEPGFDCVNLKRKLRDKIIVTRSGFLKLFGSFGVAFRAKGTIGSILMIKLQQGVLRSSRKFSLYELLAGSHDVQHYTENP